MKHIKTLNTKSLQNTLKKGGCGECQTSCQCSACKTSCTVGNQTCEHKVRETKQINSLPDIGCGHQPQARHAGGWHGQPDIRFFREFKREELCCDPSV